MFFFLILLALALSWIVRTFVDIYSTAHHVVLGNMAIPTLFACVFAAVVSLGLLVLEMM